MATKGQLGEELVKRHLQDRFKQQFSKQKKLVEVEGKHSISNLMQCLKMERLSLKLKHTEHHTTLLKWMAQWPMPLS